MDEQEENIAIWLKKGNGQMEQVGFVKYEDLYPWKKYGPYGKGTITFIQREIVNQPHAISKSVEVILTKQTTKGVIGVRWEETKEAKKSFLRVISEMDKSLEGGDSGDPGYNSNAQNGSIQVEANLVPGYGASLSIGYNWDIQGNTSISFSANQAVGFEIGVSAEIIDYHSTNGKPFNVKNLDAKSESLSSGYFAGYSRLQNVNSEDPGVAGDVYTGNSMTFSYPFSLGVSLKRGYTVQVPLKGNDE